MKIMSDILVVIIMFKKADNGSRTHDLLLTRQMLYQLSYTGYGTLLS